MGYSLSWLAVDMSIEPVLRERFGLSGTGETSEYADFTVNGLRLGDRYILQWDHEDFLIDGKLLEEVSAHGRVVAVMIEEHTMFASAEAWEGGKRTWGVVHDSGIDIMHIGTEGILPERFADISAEQH